MKKREQSEFAGVAPRPDEKTVVRQWKLLNLLSELEAGATYKQLAVKLATTPRTIQRDVEDLQHAGFVLESTNGPHGKKYWKRVAGLIPSINLNPTEAAAIYIGRKLMEPLAGTDLWEAAQDAYQKFECTFDKNTRKFLDKLAQAFRPTRFGTGDYSTYGERIDTLMLAIEERQVVTLHYQSQRTTEPAERDVHPYHLVYHRGTLYLVAYAVGHRDFRNYKVDRISNAVAEPQSLPFIPIEFNLDEYLAGSFGIYQGKLPPTKVRIRFQSSVVRYVEEKHWHETEQLTRQPDGTLLAEFVLTSFEEVKSWVLSFGPNARVLEPPELIEEIRSDLQKTIHSYEQPAPSSPLVPPSRKSSRTFTNK